MRRTPYLNVILTINAALLAALVWTQVADRPVLAQTASAQSRTQPFQPPNSATLLKKNLDEMQAIKKEVAELSALLKSGKVRVEVTNLGDLAAGRD